MIEEIEFIGVGTYDIMYPELHYLWGARLSKKQDGACAKEIKEKYGLDAKWLSDLLGETLLNATVRGNNCVIDLPVSIKTFYGQNGVVLRVRDCGPGFNFKKKMVKNRNKRKLHQTRLAICCKKKIL